MALQSATVQTEVGVNSAATDTHLLNLWATRQQDLAHNLANDKCQQDLIMVRYRTALARRQAKQLARKLWTQYCTTFNVHNL